MTASLTVLETGLLTTVQVGSSGEASLGAWMLACGSAVMR